jgi:hypothetical protein
MSLAVLWDMGDLRSAILARLSSSAGDLTPAEQVNFASKFSITGWIPDAVGRLVRRPDALSARDIETLGFDMAAKVWTLRERNIGDFLHNARMTTWNQQLTQFNTYSSPSCGTCENAQRWTAPFHHPTRLVCSVLMPGINEEISKMEIDGGSA